MGLPDTLLTAYKEKTVYNDQGQKIPLRAGVSKPEAQLLYDSCREVKPLQSMELGFGSGMSTLAILQALEDNRRGHHYVIDYNEQSFQDSGLAMVERAKLSHRMTFFREHIEDVYPELPELNFAFIDASHLFDLTVFAFVLIDKKLRIGGLIGFHDLWLPAQRQAVTYILTNRKYSLHKTAYPNRSPRNQKISNLLAQFPLGMTNWLPPGLANRYAQIRLPNLTLLRKQADDDRAWDFHVEF